MTPAETIAYVRGPQARMPLEHCLLGMRPGLSAEPFLHYAGRIVAEVLPAFA